MTYRLNETDLLDIRRRFPSDRSGQVQEIQLAQKGISDLLDNNRDYSRSDLERSQFFIWLYRAADAISSIKVRTAVPRDLISDLAKDFGKPAQELLQSDSFVRLALSKSAKARAADLADQLRKTEDVLYRAQMAAYRSRLKDWVQKDEVAKTNHAAQVENERQAAKLNYERQLATHASQVQAWEKRQEETGSLFDDDEPAPAPPEQSVFVERPYEPLPNPMPKPPELERAVLSDLELTNIALWTHWMETASHYAVWRFRQDALVKLAPCVENTLNMTIAEIGNDGFKAGVENAMRDTALKWRRDLLRRYPHLAV